MRTPKNHYVSELVQMAKPPWLPLKVQDGQVQRYRHSLYHRIPEASSLQQRAIALRLDYGTVTVVARQTLMREEPSDPLLTLTIKNLSGCFSTSQYAYKIMSERNCTREGNQIQRQG
jgi:hypothetical protein